MEKSIHPGEASVRNDMLSGCAFQEMQQVAASRDPTRGERAQLPRVAALFPT